MRRAHILVVLMSSVLIWWRGGMGVTVEAARGSTRQPLPGIYILNDAGAHSVRIPWVQGSQMRFAWQQLEPEEGRYDFSRVDAWLAMVAQGGKKGVMGVMLRCEDGQDGQDACAPVWALGYNPVMVNGKPRLNYLDLDVQRRIGRLIAALADRYAADARLSHMEIDLGFSGEASPCPSDLEAAGNLEECAAYQARYSNDLVAWEDYLSQVVRAYGERFRAVGGLNHVPLQVIINGRFFDEAQRATIVRAAREAGVGFHDTALAPDFPRGGSQEGRCAQFWQPDDAGYSDRFAYKSHWVPLERFWREVPVSFEFDRRGSGPASLLTAEERIWWSILNALDKHASVIYARESDLVWGEAWRYFLRYAGRDERTTPDAWVALRGAGQGSCGDTGDYEWFLHHRTEAVGNSLLGYVPGQAGSHLGKTWQGAFSRSTDVANRRGALYFDVDDSYMYGGERVVSVEVTYWDGTPDMAGLTWELAYDAANAPKQVAGSVTLGGTDRWLVRPFVLADATFRNRLPDASGKPGNDLRLAATGGRDIRFHAVRVRPLTTISAPAPTPTRTPTPTRGLTFGPLNRASRGSPTATARVVMPSSVSARQATVTPLPTATPTAVRAALPTATTLPMAIVPGADVVRYRANGDRGRVRDTFLSQNQSTQNFGDSNVLAVRGDGSARALLFFDLSDVPMTALIETAWLELTVVGRTQPQGLRGMLYPLPRSWGESSATWEMADGGAPWPEPGGGDDQQPIATFSFPAVGSIEIPLGALVQDWVAHPERNHGVMFRAEGAPTTEYYMASSEWGIARYRPRLRLRLAGEATPTPTATLIPTPLPPHAQVTTAPTAMLSPASATARIASVKPSAGSKDGSRIDVTAYIYADAANSPLCDRQPTVRLWGAAGQQPARPLGVATRRMVTNGWQTYPVWEFLEVDRASAQGQEPILHLFVTLDGEKAIHNIVTLGADEGTTHPHPSSPERGTTHPPTAVDASIEILWPHGDAPVSTAEKANLTAALFRFGTREMIPAHLGFLPPVRLHWSVNDGTDLAGAEPPLAQLRLIRTPWLTYYLWDFNDIDVSAAREPGRYLNFWLEVEGVEYRTNIWSHGYGPRPQPQVPLPNGSCR
jgi:hypothetical protein